MQIKIHSRFRNDVRPRNQHTLIPKLALADTVQTPAANVWNMYAKSGTFCKSGREWDLEYFCEIGMVFRLKQNSKCLGKFLWNWRGLRMFLSEEKKQEKMDLGPFCPKKRKGEGELDLKIFFVQVKRRRRVKQSKPEEESGVQSV